MTTLNNDKHATYIYGAWVVLMALTAATWWMGGDHQIAGLGRHAVMVGILLLSFAKIYVVGHAFMELREAAPWLVRLFGAWCVALCAVLSGMCLAL